MTHLEEPDQRIAIDTRIFWIQNLLLPELDPERLHNNGFENLGSVRVLRRTYQSISNFRENLQKNAHKKCVGGIEL